jgi:hypothetical protein
MSFICSLFLNEALMTGDHKFVQTKDGVLGFAVVSLDSHPNERWEVAWHDDDQLEALRRVFGPAVEAGIRLAAAAHDKHGGPPQMVEVLSIGHNPADTRSDAVVCAAAMAAWKSWGHDPNLASVEYEQGWRISFRAP